MSSPTPDDHHDGGVVLGPLDRLSDLADRIGVSASTLVAGALATVLSVAIVYAAVIAPHAPPPELTIPYATSTSTAIAEGVSTATSEAPAPSAITVHAAGAVRHPGVYVMDGGARVADVLAAAGGPLPVADLDRVNLAAPVADGVRVYVPAIGQDAPPSVVTGDAGPAPGGTSSGDPGRMIDLNRASTAELETLPGVGPATASAIVEHRERNGPFVSVEDLLAVRGIGEVKLAALRDLVHV